MLWKIENVLLDFLLCMFLVEKDSANNFQPYQTNHLHSAGLTNARSSIPLVCFDLHLELKRDIPGVLIKKGLPLSEYSTSPRGAEQTIKAIEQFLRGTKNTAMMIRKRYTVANLLSQQADSG